MLAQYLICAQESTMQFGGKQKPKHTGCKKCVILAESELRPKPNIQVQLSAFLVDSLVSGSSLGPGAFRCMPPQPAIPIVLSL